MLFQPTNIVPSSLSGIGSGTIDATEPFIATWQVNGRSKMVAYQIDIYANNSSSTFVYSTGRVTLAVPFSGVSPMGNPVFFTAEPILPMVSGLENGKEYKYIITQWWGAGSNESVRQTSANAFVTRDAPSLAINPFSDPLHGKSYTFSASYSQAQGDTINWARWRIASGDDGRDVFYDSGNLYGVNELETTYDGFFSGEDYSIRLDVQTENGIDVSTGWLNFSAYYTTKTYAGFLTATQSRRNCGVYLEWESSTSIPGKTVGEYHIVDNKCELGYNGNIEWDNVNGQTMTFSPDYSIVLVTNLTQSGGKPISVGLGGKTLDIYVATDKVYIQCGKTVLFEQAYTESPIGRWAFALNPDHIYIYRKYYSQTITYDGALGAYQEPIYSVEILGTQTCECVYVKSGALDADEIASVLNGTFHTEWNADALMLANFQNGSINGGNLDFSGYSIYREEIGKNKQVHLVDVPLGIFAMIDFSAKSQVPYVYRAYSTGDGEFLSNPLVSNEITPFYWSYSIMECRPDANGNETAIAEYGFSINIETGEMTNNNSPQMLENFTRYPLKQPKTGNYKSGTLSAYLGKVDYTNNTYSDTEEQLDALMALSTSQNNLYLKTRKGAVYKIDIDSPIKAKLGDRYAVQPYSITVPWTETGDARDVPIVALQGGELWASDEIVNTKIAANPRTGALEWTTPEPYTGGSILSVNDNGMLLQEYTSMFVPAEMRIDRNGKLVAET